VGVIVKDVRGIPVTGAEGNSMLLGSGDKPCSGIPEQAGIHAIRMKMERSLFMDVLASQIESFSKEKRIRLFLSSISRFSLLPGPYTLKRSHPSYIEKIYFSRSCRGDLPDAQDGNGNPVKLALKDIVIDTGGGGDLTLTPSQAEGPYYPVVDVSRYDHDLASLP